ncbi:hypothetical protein C8T65DRAFT_741977 [Cerioporus squamosus]|nr:hypothetical protein C8T65DRAFT_741977 [Cerioporus squamosus]
MAGREMPYVELSTPHAFFTDGLKTTAGTLDQWRPVVVVMAELAAATPTFTLTVCPVPDCGLVTHPPTPTVQLILPEDRVLIKSCSSDARIVGLRRWAAGIAVDFSLRFKDSVEFWDFLRIVSRVQSEYKIRRADYDDQSSQVVTTILSHDAADLQSGSVETAD